MDLLQECSGSVSSGIWLVPLWGLVDEGWGRAASRLENGPELHQLIFLLTIAWNYMSKFVGSECFWVLEKTEHQQMLCVWKSTHQTTKWSQTCSSNRLHSQAAQGACGVSLVEYWTQILWGWPVTSLCSSVPTISCLIVEIRQVNTRKAVTVSSFRVPKPEGSHPNRHQWHKKCWGLCCC